MKRFVSVWSVNIFHHSGKHDSVYSLQIMDKFNLSVYVEQVNREADSSIIDKWEENEELALNNVIDPNTEFKVVVVFVYCIYIYFCTVCSDAEIIRIVNRCILLAPRSWAKSTQQLVSSNFSFCI